MLSLSFLKKIIIIIIILNYYYYYCVCKVWVGAHTCCGLHAESGDNCMELVLSFCLSLCSRDGIHAVSLCHSLLYQQSHLARPFLFLALPLSPGQAPEISQPGLKSQPHHLQVLSFLDCFSVERESRAVSLPMPCLLIYEVGLLKGLNYLHLVFWTVTIPCEERTS